MILKRKKVLKFFVILFFAGLLQIKKGFYASYAILLFDEKILFCDNPIKVIFSGGVAYPFQLVGKLLVATLELHFLRIYKGL